MRTANKFALAALMMVPLALSPAAGRADPVTSLASAAPASELPMPPAPVTPGVAASNGDSLDKGVSALDDKAIDGGHAALHRLDANNGPLNMEDLNSARQTVARIDAMIEVEKHLGELQKLRSERTNGGASTSLASAIPASALTPPRAVITPMTIQPMAPPSGMGMMSGGMHDEVTRITGTGVAGKYAAVLKLSDGTLRHVKAGDELSRGARVAWISSSAVGIEEGGKTRTLHIKNVEMVYSAVR